MMTWQVFDPTYGPPECTVLQAQRGEGGLDKGAGGKFDVFSAVPSQGAEPCPLLRL